MPPKRKNTDDGEDKAKATKTKKTKVDSGDATTSENTQPTNKVMPGFKFYVEAEDADILVLTETKVKVLDLSSLEILILPGQHQVNNEPVDPALTNPGTAILSKYKPLSVDMTLPGHPDPSLVKGRIITLEFDAYYIIGTYVVNAGQNLKTMDTKKEWNTHFDTYIRALDKKKPVIWTGDLNVAPTEMGRDFFTIGP
ncbi:hypothetical protein H0H87_002887 [Tephrocybe sp. NHM501043]|nr:hypothetical protein H0H87_002887 [Tephrocybe sp. NHM501043]